VQGNNWMLYVAGVGGLQNAQSLLTNFVAQLRDLGLTIDNVQAIDGEYHGNLAKVDQSEDGWTMYLYGSGDVTNAYDVFPDFLKSFKSQGIDVKDHGIVTGTLRDIPITA
jgi:hypothetical protein